MNFHTQFRTIVFTWIRRAGLIAGYDILNTNFHIYFHNIFFQIFSLSMPVFYISTAIIYDGELAFKASSCILCGFQIVVKSSFPLFAFSHIKANIEFVENIYKSNLTVEENRSIFKGLVKILKLIVKIFFTSYSITWALVLLSPLVIFLLTRGVYEPIFPFVLPGISLGTLSGIFLTYIYQVCCAGSIVLAFAFYDSLFITQILHVKLMADILRNKIRAISEMATMETPHLDMSINFRNVLLLHDEILA